MAQAQHIFDGTGIQVTSAGRPYLGAPLSSLDFITDYMQDRTSEWVQDLYHMSSFAATQPHAAFAVFVHGFLSKLNYYLWTTPNINDLLSPLQLAICQKFLPTVIPNPYRVRIVQSSHIPWWAWNL